MEVKKQYQYIDSELMDRVAAEAHNSPRKRMNYNFHASTDEPINLIGHSFGGPASRLFASLMAYGDEAEIAATVEKHEVTNRACGIILDVNTGAVLAMAIKGDFNPNEPFVLSGEDQKKVDEEKDEEAKSKLRSELLNRQWRNKAVSDSYEPGSVFKVVTASIAIEENLISEKKIPNKELMGINFTYKL